MYRELPLDTRATKAEMVLNFIRDKHVAFVAGAMSVVLFDAMSPWYSGGAPILVWINSWTWMTSATAAAWVQAIGSVAAIYYAGRIANRQARESATQARARLRIGTLDFCAQNIDRIDMLVERAADAHSAMQAARPSKGGGYYVERVGLQSLMFFTALKEAGNPSQYDLDPAVVEALARCLIVARDWDLIWERVPYGQMRGTSGGKEFVETKLRANEDLMAHLSRLADTLINRLYALQALARDHLRPRD